MNTRTLAVLSAIILSACGGGGGGGTPEACLGPSPSNVVSPEIIAYGDSTMHAQRDRIQFALASLNIYRSFANRAVPGTNIAQLIAGSCEYRTPLAKDLADEPAATIVLENYGINEALRSVSGSAYAAHLREFVRVVQAAGKTPVIITPVPIITSQGTYLATLAEVGRQVAADTGAVLIDVHGHFAGTVTADDFIADGIHPNAAFYDRIAAYEAERLALELQP
jgi:lysophospholipase L1-like esterase